MTAKFLSKCILGSSPEISGLGLSKYVVLKDHSAGIHCGFMALPPLE